MPAKAPTKTFETRIDIEEDAREALIELLNRNLADMVDLSIQTKHAHWNVKGPDFMQLHELFDQLYARLASHADMLAERAVTLGGVANGTTRQAAANSGIGEYDLEAVDGHEHVSALAGQFAKVTARIRAAIDESDELGDLTTADLLTQISGAVDKDLWFLEAHLQARR